MTARTRREVLQASAATAIGALAFTAGGFPALAATTADLLALPNPTLDDPAKPSFEVFHRLCQLVSVRADLDETLVRRTYEVFQGEPWVEKHISTAYTNLLAALDAEPGKSIPQLIAEGALVEGERWFASHILVTLYTGIYFYEGRETVRVGFETALMWDAVDGNLQAPGTGDPQPGHWSQPPPGAH